MTNGQDTNADASAAPTGDSGPPPANLFWLKALVGGLAALMGLVMLIVIGRIGYLTFGPSELPPADKPIALQLPAGMSIDAISLDGSRVGILARGGDGKTAIGIYDVRSGALIRRFETQAGGQ